MKRAVLVNSPLIKRWDFGAVVSSLVFRSKDLKSIISIIILNSIRTKIYYFSFGKNHAFCRKYYMRPRAAG